MNKTAFLEELKQHLKVLEESEQQDILNEYSVHIDMKMERGMSEEEAIRDFGDTRRLAQDILEAYHLNPQYADRKSSAEAIQEKALGAAAAAGGAAHRLGGRLKALTGSCWRLLVRCVNGLWRLLCSCCRKIWLLLCLFGRRLTGKAGETPSEAEERSSPQSPAGSLPKAKREPAGGKAWGQVQRKKGVVTMLGDMLGKFVRLTGRAVRWTLRWCRNLMLLGMAVLTGLCAIFLLFSFGLLAVLLIAGYPLWGMAIAALGGFLSSASLTVLLYLGLRRKRKSAVSEPKQPEGGSDAQSEKIIGESLDEAENAVFSAGNQEVFVHA